MTLQELETLYASLTPSNGNEFIKAIRTAAKESGTSSLELMGKLEQFVSGFRPEGRRICAVGASMTSEDRDALTLQGRIVAALLLVLHKTNSSKGLRSYTLLFLEYASAVVRTKYDYLTTALDVICYKITSPGIDWHIVQEVTSLDLLSYKLIKGIRFDKSSPEIFSFQGKGLVRCQDGRLSVCSSDALESGAKAFSICKDRVGVYTRNVRDEKLKSTEQFDAAALRDFAETYLGVQRERSGKGTRKREYHGGEKVAIQVLSYNEDIGGLDCEIVDRDCEERGVLHNEELVKGLWTDDLVDYICDRDCIRGAVLYKQPEGLRFSIGEAYTAFAREMADRDFRENVCFQARAYRVDEKYGKVNWMAPTGYGGITSLEETPGVKVGDMAILQVKNVKTDGPNTYINLCPPRFDIGTVRPFPDEENVLYGFIAIRKDILSSQAEAKQEQSETGQDTLEALTTILSSTTERRTSLDAYRHLLVALFISGVRDDGDAVGCLREEAHYLGQCLSFAQGARVRPSREVVLPVEKEAVVRILSCWDDPGTDVREDLLRWEEGSVPGKVARLLFGLRVAGAFQDELKADREVVRKRVCEILGVEDAFEAEGALRKGKYGVAEGHEVEFKSSYVFRNDGKGADIDYQGRGQVFEAVCGFLNADGGILYLGVNDAGDPIVAQDRGLNADISWLSEHYLQINQSRMRSLGHPVPKADSLDHYVLFLNAEKELYFKETFLGNIIIEVTEDGDAIRISVSPAEYEIAYLYSDRNRSDGVAYVRDGGRTIPMSRKQKEQRLTSLKRITKEMGFVVTIQEAIDQHRRLIFRGYASGNSGEVRDRYVVPVNLFYNDENVYCYDLEARKMKQFRLHRIGGIDYSEDTSPYTLPVMVPRQADVFRWIVPDGGRSYHVRLRMDVGARNYLLEEYSCAEKLPEEEFYEEKKNKWILDTHVNGLGAVRRFYLGLADKIEILDTEDSEELKKDIAEYVARHIGEGRE